jgi:dGTPase
MHKTQVFLSPEGDHYRTRLTHTLEVAQIARTMAVALQLNENLTEAIALGHDLGHTPFGHAGERALDEIAPEGFRHYEQSVRVVERLERDGAGLNLTWEVRDGIGAHTTGRACTLEADSSSWRIISPTRIMTSRCDPRRRTVGGGRPRPIREELGKDRETRLTALINSVIENSSGDIQMDGHTEEVFADLEAFMFGAVYTNPVAKSQEHKAMAMLKQLYAFFLDDPNRLPPEYLAIAFSEGADRAICDYISGMSDRYAIKLYTDYFVPKGWSRE